MDETCHKAQEIDLALFLLEPHGSQWQEFRVHYPYCATCSAEIQKWSSLEQRLRAMGNASAALHPSAEALVQFQRRTNLLPVEERGKIDVHLRSCAACREEVNLLNSFDPSVIQRWTAETPITAIAEAHASWSGRAWDALRSLFLHPVFVYGFILLLSVPFIRSYYSSSFNQTPTSTDVGSTSVPISARGKAELKQEQESPVGEMQATRTLPQVTASAPTRLQPPSEKTKEDGSPTKLAKQSARREDFALKDERVPVPPPTSPAPSIAASARARDAEVPARQKSPLAKEEKPQAFSEPPGPTPPVEREARSTEPLTSQKKRLAEEGTSAASTASGAPSQVAGLTRRNTAPQDSQSHSAFSALMDTYKNAYEARDLDALGHVWNMDPAWRDATTRLFTNSRQIAVSLALDEENMTESADQRQVSAPFSQTVTTINQDGQVSTHGPFFCLADLRKQSANIWRIQELQEDPQHPGQCRLQP